MARYTSPLTLLFCLIFGSCQTIEQIPIDYMMPADISFPSELRRVAIVNNTSAAPDDKWRDSESRAGQNEIARAVAYHNGKSDMTTESLAETIANENYFDEVVICDSVLRANDKIPRESTLSREEVKELTERLNVDFIISLENLLLKATKVVRFLPEWSCYYGSVDMNVYPEIKVYIPNRKGPMLTINAKDSIFWEKYGNSDTYVRLQLTNNDSQMLEEASEFAGSIPVKHLLPYWKSATRYLYTSGSVNMRDAAVYVRENSWEKALKLWKQAFLSTKSNKKKMRAALNIALYYEIKDDVEQAETWALKAQELIHKSGIADKEDSNKMNTNEVSDYVAIALYLEELQERKEGLPKLNIQMQRFNDDF